MPGEGATAIRAVLSRLSDPAQQRAFLGGDLPKGTPFGVLKPDAAAATPEQDWVYDPAGKTAYLRGTQPGESKSVQVASDSSVVSDAPPPGPTTAPQQAPANPSRMGQISRSAHPKGSDIATEVPPVPSHRAEVFRSPDMQKRWETFNRASAALPDAGRNERAIYTSIYAEEGGDRVNPTNGSSSGITKTTLEGLRKKNKLGDVPADATPESLATDEKPAIIRAYFDDVLEKAGGHKAFETLDPQSAKALASTLYVHGGPAGTRAIPAAIRATKGAAESNIADEGLSDGKLGGETLKAFKSITDDPGRRAALLDVLAAERTKLRTDEKGNIARGEKEMIDRYRISTPDNTAPF